MTDDVSISRRNLRPVTITSFAECTVMSVGTMEIWDGADLSLIRETIRRLIEEEECHTLGIDMSSVKHVPGGFFGTLCDWHDKGICIRLFGPQSPVKQMLWFTRFFRSIGNDFYELGPAVESDFDEPVSKCAQADQPDNIAKPPLKSSDQTTPSVSIQENRNADFSAAAPIV